MPKIYYESVEQGIIQGYVAEGDRILRFKVPVTGLAGIETLSKTVNVLLHELSQPDPLLLPSPRKVEVVGLP